MLVRWMEKNDEKPFDKHPRIVSVINHNKNLLNLFSSEIKQILFALMLRRSARGGDQSKRQMNARVTELTVAAILNDLSWGFSFD